MGYKNLKTYFQSVLWTDESCGALDGPDDWSRGQFQKGANPRLRYKRQHGGEGLIILAGIIGNQVVGPFLVPESLKMNSASDCLYLKKHLLPC